MAERVRSLVSDRVNLALVIVFLLSAVYYTWIATLTTPVALHGASRTPYNQLADAFLHLHLWVVNLPPHLLPANPVDSAHGLAPVLRPFGDYVLYGHYLYLEWGPAPALTWLLPLHLLGFEPSASVIIAPFTIGGVGFALATLRVISRHVGAVTLPLVILAALTLACASVVPYILGFPLTHFQAVAGGYFFSMAGIWLAVSTIAMKRASLPRLALMSLLFGLAAGSRPTLGLTGLVLIPVYTALRSRPRLLVTLATPFVLCILLLAAYNQSRFGDPLQYGVRYQINGGTQRRVLNELSYLPPGVWSYLFTPPRVGAIFPFLSLIYPQASYPLNLPTHYVPFSEPTGGLIPMTPIVVYLVALPWMRRRHQDMCDSLGSLLVVMMAVGLMCMVYLAYAVPESTERYAVDYTTLLLLGAIAVWLALSHSAQGYRRWVVRATGGLLAVWGCFTGMAISYEGLQHAGTLKALVNIGAPVSTAMSAIAGHPLLADVYTPNVFTNSPTPYRNLGTTATGFWLTFRDRAELTIVSPDSREDALITNTFAGPALPTKTLPSVRVIGPSNLNSVRLLSNGGGESRIPVHLHRGLNRLVLTLPNVKGHLTSEAEPESRAAVVLTEVHLASS